MVLSSIWERIPSHPVWIGFQCHQTVSPPHSAFVVVCSSRIIPFPSRPWCLHQRTVPKLAWTSEVGFLKS